MKRNEEHKHHSRVVKQKWKVVRHDGVLLGGYSHEAHARRACWVLCREGGLVGHAYVQLPKDKAKP